MVSKPYYRVDLFNRQMTDVLLTSLLVTIIENKTVAHIGTSTGRLLQVHSMIYEILINNFLYLSSLDHCIWSTTNNHMLCLCWQLVLTRSSPIIFANYSLVENQRVSSIAAVYSSEFLLFVVGDKVQQQSHVFKWEWNHLSGQILETCNDLVDITASWRQDALGVSLPPTVQTHAGQITLQLQMSWECDWLPVHDAITVQCMLGYCVTPVTRRMYKWLKKIYKFDMASLFEAMWILEAEPGSVIT